jgi:hypothetical protein
VGIKLNDGINKDTDEEVQGMGSFCQGNEKAG